MWEIRGRGRRGEGGKEGGMVPNRSIYIICIIYNILSRSLSVPLSSVPLPLSRRDLRKTLSSPGGVQDLSVLEQTLQVFLRNDNDDDNDVDNNVNNHNSNIRDGPGFSGFLCWCSCAAAAAAGSCCCGNKAVNASRSTRPFDLLRRPSQNTATQHRPLSHDVQKKPVDDRCL